jgi:CubicO group peptidase (beta-lactamase class C family)
MTLERTRAVAERGISRGAFRSLELAVSCAGAEPCGFRLGPAHERLWTCATKCLLAVAVASLVTDQVIRYDDRLADHLPELAGTGWGPVPLRSVLSHSVGITSDIAVLSVCMSDPEVLQNLAANPPDPALPPAYTQWTSSFLIGQVIARVTGQPHEAYLLGEIGGRLGLRDTRLVYPATRVAELAEGVRPLLAAAGEGRPALEVRADRVWPGVSGSGPMTDLARIVGSLLPARSEAIGLVSRAVAGEVTAVHREGISGHANDNGLAWGLGVAVDRRLGIPKCSPGVFGHFGLNGSVLVFADPAADMVAGLSLAGAGTGNGISKPLWRASLTHALLADIQDECGGIQKPNSVSLRRSQSSR